MDNTQKFDLWCIVELFGHTQIAGKCTEQNIAGTNMLRVDVPETKSQGAFTKFFGSGAIYAINPVEETVARSKAEMLNIAPIQTWQISTFNEKIRQLGIGSEVIPDPEDLHDDDDDFDAKDYF